MNLSVSWTTQQSIDIKIRDLLPQHMESSHPHSWSQVHCPAGLRLLIKGPRLLRSKWCDPSANAATVTAAVILAGVLDCHLLSATNQLCDCGWCFRWVSIVGVAWLTFYCFVLYWAKPWEYLVYTGDIKWGQVLWPLGSKSRNRSFTLPWSFPW